MTRQSSLFDENILPRMRAPSSSIVVNVVTLGIVT